MNDTYLLTYRRSTELPHRIYVCTRAGITDGAAAKAGAKAREARNQLFPGVVAVMLVVSKATLDNK